MTAAIMSAGFDLQSLAELFAGRILNCAADGMVIAVLAWLVLRTAGRRNSGTRFAVWFAALVGIATLLFLGRWVPNGVAVAPRSAITMPASWALYICGAWSMIALAGLFRVGLGFWHLQRLRKNCLPVDRGTLDPVLQETLKEFGSTRPVQVSVSDKLRVPTAIGFMKPLVVIPSWTMKNLTTAELNAVMLHELAHLRRRDDWTNLIQKILGALLFFHPAVWWIEKKLTLEREMACDDLVLARTASPQAYAECLVSLAEKSLMRRGLSLAQAAVDRLRHLSLRVAQILDVNRPKVTGVWRPAPILITGVSVLCLAVLSHSPTQLVSFGDHAAPSLAARDVESRGAAMNEMSRTGAHVIPAKLELGNSEAVRKGRKHVSETVKAKSSSQQSSGPAMIPVRFDPANRPALLRSNLVCVAPASRRGDGRAGCPPDSRRDAGATQSLYFVTRTEFLQTQEYDPSGAVVWNVYVWRVIVVGQVENKMQSGEIAKSI